MALCCEGRSLELEGEVGREREREVWGTEVRPMICFCSPQLKGVKEGEVQSRSPGQPVFLAQAKSSLRGF